MRSYIPTRRGCLGVLLSAALAATLAGCLPRTEPSPRVEVFPASDLAKPENRSAAVMLLVGLEMLVVEVPVGTASGSEDIWSYLDEEAVQAMPAAGLGRNGFRVGVGRQDTWDDLAAVLNRLTGRQVKRTSLTSSPGRPQPVVLRISRRPQTIFLSHADRTLSGDDYPPGENGLLLGFTVDSDRPERLIVTAVPQITSTKRTPRYVEAEGGYRWVFEPQRFPLEALRFQLSLGTDEFIVIGPNQRALRPTSAAGQFLIKDKQGLKVETVLVLKPRTFAARLGEKPARPGR